MTDETTPNLICIEIASDYAVGSQPPPGYGNWHEWAKIQYKAGLRQSRCKECKLFHFPQEHPCDTEIEGRGQRAGYK